MSAGANKGRRVEIETMIRDYWQQFGWDAATGHPQPEAMPSLEETSNATSQA